MVDFTYNPSVSYEDSTNFTTDHSDFPIEYCMSNESKIRREKDLIKKIFDFTGGEGFICGGFARYVMSPLDKPAIPGDIDIFCMDQDIYNRIYDRLVESDHIRKRHESPIEIKFKYVINDGFFDCSYNIQLIKPVEIFNMVGKGKIWQILQSFDFTIAKCAIEVGKNGEFITWYHEKFENHERYKTLEIENIHCPVSSTLRTIKYVKKGYSITSKEIIKLFADWENREPEWKSMMTRGFSGGIQSNTPDFREFVQLAYLD